MEHHASKKNGPVSPMGLIISMTTCRPRAPCSQEYWISLASYKLTGYSGFRVGDTLAGTRVASDRSARRTEPMSGHPSPGLSLNVEAYLNSFN